MVLGMVIMPVKIDLQIRRFPRQSPLAVVCIDYHHEYRGNDDRGRLILNHDTLIRIHVEIKTANGPPDLTSGCLTGEHHLDLKWGSNFAISGFIVSLSSVSPSR